MIRRLATTDGLLVTLSCAAIIVSIWPSNEPRQCFLISRADGTASEYSLPLSDPALLELRRRCSETNPQLPPAKLAIAKWTREISDFYGKRCRQDSDSGTTESGTVITVSFDDSRSGQLALVSDPSSAAYWLALRDRADQVVADLQKQLASRTSTAPSVVFGEVLAARDSLLTWFVAIAVGMLLAWGYEKWRQLCPPVVLTHAGDRQQLVRLAVVDRGSTAAVLDDSSQQFVEQEDRQSGDIEFPVAWIRVRQPIAVLARRLCLLVFAAGALASALS